MKNPYITPKGWVRFFQEVVEEVRRITWPTWSSIWGGTLAVIAISAFTTLYIWVADLIFSRLLALILR